MASHEFRTPLTIIDGHARRLIKMQGCGQPPTEIGERAGKIRAAVLRLTHLIDNLLNSARLIDGGAELYFHPAEMDMAALLHEVCQVHREMVPGAQITERFAPTPMPMVGDAKLLFQVFSNLLSNAVKYSPDGGAIEVEAEVAADEVVVTVADRGIGIPAGDLVRLFERYHRGSNVSGIVGTGVGLYLVKMAVDLHGGRIEVDSKEGDGARFTIRLPLKRASKPNVAPSELEPRTLLDALSIAISFGKHSMKNYVTCSFLLASFAYVAARCQHYAAPPIVLFAGSRLSRWIGRVHCPSRGGFATIAPVMPSAAVLIVPTIAGLIYQFYFCSRQSFGCCRVGFGYCDWTGLLRCAP